jgi:hypothetical protein
MALLYSNERLANDDPTLDGIIPKAAGSNGVHRVAYPAPDGPEGFHPLFTADEPGIENGLWIGLAVNETGEHVRVRGSSSF